MDQINNLNAQQLSKYKQQLTKDWKNYVNTTGREFLSQNKLYLKTIQDYLTREYKGSNSIPKNVSMSDIQKPVVSGTAQPKLPNIKIMPNNTGSNKGTTVNVDIQSIGSAEQKLPIEIRQSPSNSGTRAQGALSAFASSKNIKIQTSAISKVKNNKSTVNIVETNED